MTDYSSLEYWENRYQNEHLEIFEWYQVYETLKEKISDYIKPEDKILYVGCGTSSKFIHYVTFLKNSLRIYT